MISVWKKNSKTSKQQDIYNKINQRLINNYTK